MKNYKIRKSTEEEIPKHLKSNKDFNKRQVQAKVQKNKNRMLGAVFVVFALIIGAGLFVYNLDEFILRDKKEITMSFSNNFQQGGEAPVIITLEEFDSTPAADEDVKIELEYTQANQTRIVTLSKTKTNNKGVITPKLKLPEDCNGSAKLIVTVDEQKLEQKIIVDEQSKDTVTEAEERLKILVSTDKPLYQPGQTINIRTLAMYGTNKGLYTDNITIEIDDPEDNKPFRTELDCNDWGIASTNFTVTDQMPLGNYKIIAKIGAKESKKSVTVKEYVLPRFNIVFNDIKSWYTVDEDITGSINCNYFFGKPIKGQIEFKARTSYGGIWDTVHHEKKTLSEEGDFDFIVPKLDYAVGLPINQDNGLVELNATITDNSGHTESKLMPVTIARKPILITTISDTNIKGVDSRYYVLTQAPDGSIIEKANVSASLDDIEVYKGTSSSKGLAEFKFKYNGQKELEIKAEKGSISATELVNIIPGKGIKLASDKMYYAVGEEAKFDVYYGGESFTKWVYYDVIADGFTVNTGAFKLSSGKLGRGSFTLDLTPEMVGTTYVRVYKIEKDEDVVSDRLGLAVAPTSELEVSIENDDEIYNPNQPVFLRFKVTEDNQPVQGALGVSIIDQSLYALSERFGGFEDIYFELEQIALEPQYQIWEYVFNFDTTSKNVPLPETSVVDPGEYQEGYSYPRIGLKTNYNTEIDKAANAKSEYVNMYWACVFILVFIGLIALTFYGIRRSKPSLVVGVLIILVIATVVGGVLLRFEEPETPEDKDWTYHGVAAGSDLEKEEEEGLGGNQTGGGNGDGDGVPDDWEDEWAIEDGKEADKDAKPAPPNFMPRPGAADMNTVDDDNDGDGFTNIEEYSSGTDPGAKRQEREVHVREYFPETWYWNPVLITDEKGVAELELTTPDSITTWEVKAVANTKDAKLGVTNENLTVFQQFFIEPDIPVSVVRNDSFPLRIMVYNYDNVSREITVSLEEDTWFETKDETIKKVTVPSDNVSKVIFTIRALEVGEHNVTISGYNGKAWDDVIKPMRVDPDGKLVSETFNGKLSDNQSIKETITKSSDRVPDSENAFIKLQGGMEAVLLDGAETFIRHVSGCGEQSMSTLNINILAFDTVQKLGTATEEKMFEYEQMTTQGIQHEMQYLLPANNGKGRGIVWFPGDEDVHQWLTSWGLITFQDAINAGFDIDSAIITDMQSWLLSQQEDDGSFVFPERGLYEFTNPILRAKTVSCSAYITRSLIYSGYSPSNAQIQNAVGYIEEHAKDDEVWNDPYSLSLVLIVLEDANGDSTLRNQLAARLDELKKVDEEKGIVWWESGTSMITDSDYGYYGYGSNYHTIETTGYAVMALARNKGPMNNAVQKGIKYLIENRQGLGGWYSTQDTVVAFQALKEAGTNNVKDLTVEISAGSKQVEEIKFDESNIDLTFLVDLRPYLKEFTEITIKSIGLGSIMYQIYYEEYIPWDIIGADKPQELILDITYDATDIKVNDKIKATLDLKYVGQADHVKMVLVDIRAPVGFSFVEEDFKTMISDGDISQYEINNRQAYLYIQDLSYGESITLVYHLLANDPIRGTIQGVQAYDMYNPGLTAELEPVEVTSTI